MNHDLPLISIVVPCYNYAAYLPQAVGSILSQSGTGFRTEIIIVDDGSSDDTAEVASSFGDSVRYIYQDNQGPSVARNTGILNANGDYLVFLDADDELGPNTLSTQLANFKDQPDLDISISHCIYAGEENANPHFWALAARQHDLHLCRGNISPVHTFMLRTDRTGSAGLFDPALRSHEDYDFWLRCARQGLTFGVNPDAYVIYRQHADSLSTRLGQHWASEAAVRAKARVLLETQQGFPLSGKYSGWLAYAAGQMDCACRLMSQAETDGIAILHDSVDAILRAADLVGKVKNSDADDSNEDLYFTASFLRNARAHGSMPGLEKAVGFLAKRYPRLAALSDKGLQNRFYKLRSEICVDTRPMIPALKALESGASETAH